MHQLLYRGPVYTDSQAWHSLWSIGPIGGGGRANTIEYRLDVVTLTQSY
jgi:hypothetical protein